MGQRGKEKIFQIHEPINIRPRPDEYEYRTAKLMAAFIITLFRSRMSPKMAESEIRRHFLRATRVKRAILITKSGNVIVVRGRV